MKLKITSVEMKDTGQNGKTEYTVTKVVREEAESRGEAVNPIPSRVEVYKGENRVDAQRVHDEAQAEMFR